MKKNPTKKERKELYLQAIDVVVENMTTCNYLCNVLGELYYKKNYDCVRGEKFINEETFPELLLFRELDRPIGSAWLSLSKYWISNEEEDHIVRNKIINEGKLTILTLCIEMCE